VNEEALDGGALDQPKVRSKRDYKLDS